MRMAVLFGLVFSAVIASACGGKVVTDRPGGDEGGGGAGGGEQGEGGAASCTVVECSNEGSSSCTCQTSCKGPDLRAECDLGSDGEIVCECHYDGAYLGLCSMPSGSVCGLPGGCCYAFLP